MSKEVEAVEVMESTETVDEGLVIKLARPFNFEHKDYTEIDLSGLEDLSANDLVQAEKMYKRTNGGVEVMPELSIEYAFLLAARATGLPIEFFMALPPKVGIRVRGRVMGFLYGRE